MYKLFRKKNIKLNITNIVEEKIMNDLNCFRNKASMTCLQGITVPIKEKIAFKIPKHI